VVTDNALKDIETEEDTQFINTANAITGPSNGVGASGVQQNFVLTGGFERDTYVNVLNLTATGCRPVHHPQAIVCHPSRQNAPNRPFFAN